MIQGDLFENFIEDTQIKKVPYMKTYISLFSSAGVGCFGFKKAGFECIATNEIIERRLQIQKYNNKCRYDTGYICGDITLSENKDKIFNVGIENLMEKGVFPAERHEGSRTSGTVPRYIHALLALWYGL